MTNPAVQLMTAAATYKREHSKLAPLEAAQQAAHDDAYNEAGLPTSTPGAYARHMTAVDALEGQRRVVQRASAALCAAALKTDFGMLTPDLPDPASP